MFEQYPFDVFFKKCFSSSYKIVFAPTNVEDKLGWSECNCSMKIAML